MKRTANQFAVLLAALTLIFSFATNAVIEADPPEIEPSGSMKGADKAKAKAAKGAKKYADWCIKEKAFTEARTYIKLAAYVGSDASTGKKALAKAAGKKDEVGDDFEADKVKKMASFLKSGQDLFKHVMSCRKKNADYQGLETGAIWLLYFRDDEYLAKNKWQWNDEFKLLMSDKDAERWANGDVRYQGKWLDAEKLAEANPKHNIHETAWHLEDSFHYMKSSRPLEDTIPLFGFNALHRTRVLADFYCIFELKKPKKLLPILLGETREDYDKLYNLVATKWLNTSGGNSRGSGIYLNHTLYNFTPVVLCNYAKPVGGEASLYTEFGRQRIIQHEVTHQVLFECRDHVAKEGDQAKFKHSYWAMEGIAGIAENYYWDGNKFVFKIMDNVTIHKGSGQPGYSRFSRAVADIDSFPSVAELTGYDVAEFSANSVRNYAHGCTLLYYMLNKAGEDIRKRALKILLLAHDYNTDERTFAVEMKGVDIKKLEKDYREFVAGIEFED